MALNVQKGVLTAAASNGGTTTVNLPSGFDAKLVQMWTTLESAEGASAVDGALCLGFGTRDGGGIQQAYVYASDNDAATSMDVSRGIGRGSFLRATDAGTITIVFEADLTTFTAEQIVVTFNTTLAGRKIHYLALGGSDISAARVDMFQASVAAATQDVTVLAGWGQPDLILFASAGGTQEADTAGDSTFMLSAAKSATDRRMSLQWSDDGNATMAMGSDQRNIAISAIGATGAKDQDADLAAKASWPTDGFQLAYSDQAAVAVRFVYVALKGTFTATIGSAAVPTAAAPQVQDLAHGSPPKAALFWGTPLPNQGGVPWNTTHADLGGFMIGGTDGVDEGAVGITQDDGNAASFAGRWHNEQKAILEYTAGATATAAPIKTAEADATISGDNLRLTWNDTDSVAREFSYLLLGDALASSTPVSASDSISLTEGVALSATSNPSDPMTLTEALALAVAADRADNFTLTEASAKTAQETLSASDLFTLLEQSPVAIAQSTAGDPHVFSEAAGLQGSLSAADSAVLTELVALTLQRDVSDLFSMNDIAALAELADKVVTDSFVLSEQATISELLFKAASDLATLSEASQILEVSLFSASDTQTFLEALSVSSSLALTDTIALAEASSKAETLALNVTDALTLSEAAAVVATAIAADSALFAELSSVADTSFKVGADGFSLAEIATVEESIFKAVSDALTMLDSSALAATTGGSDAATLSSVLAIAATLLAEDDAQAAEVAAVAATLAALDVSTLTDLASVNTAAFVEVLGAVVTAAITLQGMAAVAISVPGAGAATDESTHGQGGALIDIPGTADVTVD